MTFAVPSDVTVRLGPALAAAADVDQVQAFLDTAEALIRVRFPNLDAQVAAGVVPAQNVVLAEANAVRRVMLNAEGFVSESIDNWSGTRAAGFADAEVSISVSDWALLSPLIEGRRRGSIRLVAYGERIYGAPYVLPVYP